MGNLKEMHDMENTGLVHRWEAEYGSSFVYHGFVGGCRLMTTDPLAIAHILGQAYDYPKPDFVRDNLATMAAGHEGLIVVEGEQHRKQVCTTSQLGVVANANFAFRGRYSYVIRQYFDFLAIPNT